MSDIHQAAHQYVEMGWSILPLEPGRKNPTASDWTAMRLGRNDIAAQFDDGDNIGILLGEPSGHLVDTDLETIEVVRCAPWFMPPTGAVFGRSSKPESHWLYRIPSTIRRTLFYDPQDQTLLLEIRGDGHQTMAPPSVHPSGEQVVWYKNTGPAEIEEETYVRACGITAAAAFFVRHWSEWPGNHHAIVLHLAGGLLRAGWPCESVEQFVSAICNVAGDHEPADRINAVRSTAKALEEENEVTGWPSLINFIPDPILDTLREWLGVANYTSRLPMTDEGNAQRMAHYFSDRIRYCRELGCWLIWDGRHWEPDHYELTIINFMRETIDRIWTQEVPKEPDKDRREQLAKFALYSQNVTRMYAGPKLARSHPKLTIHNRQLDAQAHWLNVENGTINLQTGGLQPHNKEDYITNIVPIRYTPGAKINKWQEFLDRFVPDKAEQLFLQKAVGYSMTGDTGERAFFILYGEGMNGKSTFMNVLTAMLGTYARTADITTFMKQKSDKTRTDLARLVGSRMVSSGEPEEGDRLAAGLVKALSGDDTIVARFLYQKEFEFRPTFKIWLATNHKPRVPNEKAIWDRLRLMPFTQSIDVSEKINRYEDILLREEAPGILNWCVEGAQLWLAQGLGKPPEIMEEATEDYRRESDNVAMFIDQLVERVEEAKTPSGQMYATYSNWCRDNGERQLSNTRFKERMSNAGFEMRRENGNVWLGAELQVSVRPVDLPDSPTSETRNAFDQGGD